MPSCHGCSPTIASNASIMLCKFISAGPLHDAHNHRESRSCIQTIAHYSPIPLVTPAKTAEKTIDYRSGRMAVADLRKHEFQWVTLTMHCIRCFVFRSVSRSGPVAKLFALGSEPSLNADPHPLRMIRTRGNLSS